jgi:CDP-glucose 4,6-dehydratase
VEGVGVSARSVLVTGGRGLLGSWLVKGLLEQGDRVAVFDRGSDRVSALALEGTVAHVALVNGDIGDREALDRALREQRVDTVFHLAAQTLVGTARQAPAATFEANVGGTWKLLEACRASDVARVVVASSDKAYGPARDLPYVEDQPLRAIFPYDASKAAADVIARSYWHSFGLPVAVTRFANIYGGGDLNPSRLIPETIWAALEGRAPVIRSDGTPERDYLYVGDAVAAYLAIADALDRPQGARGEAFNAGGGKPHAVADVVALVLRVAGADLRPDIRGAGTPPGELDRQYVDYSKLAALTGWAPQVGLEEGLDRAVRWYRQYAPAPPSPPHAGRPSAYAGR